MAITYEGKTEITAREKELIKIFRNCSEAYKKAIEDMLWGAKVANANSEREKEPLKNNVLDFPGRCRLRN